MEILNFDNLAIGLDGNPTLAHAQSLSLLPGQYKTCYDVFSCGESRLLRAILAEPESSLSNGRVLGYALNKLSRSRRRHLLQQVGIISLKLAVPAQSLSEFIALPLQIAGLRRSQIDRRVRAMLSEFELTIFARDPLTQADPIRLRRAYLAQALIKSPKLILFEAQGDEVESVTIVPALRRYVEHGGAVLEVRDISTAEFAQASLCLAEERVYAAG